MIRRSVTKTFKFSAGHFLPNHNGKCRRQHGHNYRVDISVRGPVNPVDGSSSEGMVVDFDILKNIAATLIDGLDHYNLNDVAELPQPPTAEHLAGWMYEQLAASLPSGLSMNYVTVWETDSSSATVANV